MTIILNNVKLQEYNFQLESDFENEVFSNYQTLFGRDTILLDFKKSIDTKYFGSTIPDGFLINFTDRENPEFYLVEIELGKHSFYNHIFPQITKFFAFFKNQEQQGKLVAKLYEMISENEEISTRLSGYLDGKEIFKFLNDLIDESQNILIAIDGNKSEFTEISDVYHDTWGKMVKHLVLRKFVGNDGESVYDLHPDFEVLDYVGSETPETEVVGITEEDHFSGVDENITKIYRTIKQKITELGKDTVFNPQKYYISIKSKKNICYLIIQKKKIRAVIMKPENRVREEIKSYVVKSLSKSVQKFYSGECADILLTNSDHLDEFLNCIKPLITDHAND